MKSFTTTSALLLLLTTPLLVTAQFEGGGGFGGPPKFCPPYRCRKGEEPVPKWPLKLSSPGCAGMGGMAMMNMGKGGDEEADPLIPCCDLRHACLQTCGSIKTFCDEEFTKCIESTCNGQPNEEDKKACESSASVHKIMVQMDNSCQKFDAEQYAHCECVKAEKIADKREQLLSKFYKKFNPDSISKVAGLAAKVDSSRKMAALLLKLYKKYPTVIKRVKDPQAQEWERMMKDAGSKEPKDEEDAEEEEEDNSETQEL